MEEVRLSAWREEGLGEAAERPGASSPLMLCDPRQVAATL